MHGGVTTECLEVVGVVEVVAVVVDGCVVAVNTCDVNCDEETVGKVPVGNIEGLGSGMSWSELVGLGVIPFFGHSFMNASQRCSHESFCVAGRALHHRSA